MGMPMMITVMAMVPRIVDMPIIAIAAEVSAARLGGSGRNCTEAERDTEEQGEVVFHGE
jgi:hypothetical protein